MTAKFLLELLNFDRKKCLVNIAQELLYKVSNDPEFFKTVITHDKTYIFVYYVDIEIQSSQRNVPEEELKIKIYK